MTRSMLSRRVRGFVSYYIARIIANGLAGNLNHYLADAMQAFTLLKELEVACPYAECVVRGSGIFYSNSASMTGTWR